MILIDSYPRHGWLVQAVERRLREELAKLRVEINEDKSRMVDLAKGGSFTFLGFEHRRILSRNRVWRPYYAPKLKKRTAAVCKAAGGLPAKRQPARREGDRRDQSDPTWVGELLSSGAFESLFLHGQALGGKEGPAASDAVQTTIGYGLEKVE